MTSYSSKSSSASSPSSSCRRKFMDSTVIGYSQQQRQQRHTKKPRVVSCNFEMRIPTNALQIDMTILVSTNNDNGTPSCCYDDENETPNTPLSPPRCRPSVSYNITICKPPPPPPRSSSLQSKDATTTTTIRWSSKFTIAKDLDENIDPFHEWNGSFTLGEKQDQKIPPKIEDCSFYQLQGTFLGDYDDDDDDDDDPLTQEKKNKKRKTGEC